MPEISCLELRSLSLAYRADLPLLKEANASFEAGHLYIVKGPSGIGKTSLLSLIGLLEKPSGGQIFFGGQKVSPAEREAFRKKHISFLFQDLLVFPSLTGLANLMLSGCQEDEACGMARRLGLDGLLRKKAKFYSKGETMRLALGRVFLEGKEIVLLDEPTGNLDDANKRKVALLLREEAKKKIVIVVSHDLVPDEESDVLLTFENGKLVARGNEAEREVATESRSSFPRCLQRKDFTAIFAAGLAKIPVKTFFFVLLFAFLGFLASTTSSFLSYDPAAILKSRYEELGLVSLTVQSPEPPPGAFALMGASFEQGAAKVSVNYIYGEGSFSPYGTAPKGNVVLASSFALEYYGLQEGTATLSGIEVELASVPVEETTVEAYRSYFGPSYEEELAYALPFQVGDAFIAACFAENGFEVDPSVFAPFLEGAALEETPILSCRLVSGGGDKASISLPSSFDNQSVLSSLREDGLAVVPPRNGRGFRLDRLVSRLEVGEVTFNNSLAVVVRLPKTLSEATISGAYELNPLSANRYAYGSHQADYGLALAYPHRVYGFSSEEFDFLSSSYQTLVPWAGPLFGAVLILFLAGAYLIAYELYRVYFRPAALLSLIGYRKIVILSLSALYLLLFLVIPFLFGSILLGPLMGKEISSFLASIISRNPLFNLLPLSPLTFLVSSLLPFLSLLLVPLFFRVGKSFLSLIKQDRK